MKKRLVILGSTGSIGRATLDIVSKNIDRIEVLGLSAHSNIDLLSEQVKIYSPSFVVVTDQRTYGEFKSRHHSTSFRLLNPSHGIEELTSLHGTDIVLNAIVGAAGLSASISTVKAGKRLALANKESMIIGGSLINELLRSSGAELIPVDSEHSAIWQALFSGKKKEIKRIILTGSGGPFRETALSGFPNITKEQALNHPVWKMGPKISIDSATMMNKGLEVIEAVQLFGVPPEKIKVVIHPQSIILSGENRDREWPFGTDRYR
ncbi:MAG: 1-deoxy-D-xylulose-5-phosphate reductoisomerase [candidate division Zixibacteria bacterium]|nr:1-deoxy-D-xylulose-5-phosphate reductoisomerase [candidate division Zixibacteria bacterium]